MFAEVFWVFVIVMVFRVLVRHQSLRNPRLWWTSAAGSFLGVLVTVLVVAHTMFPTVG
jgi:hypothetical protein